MNMLSAPIDRSGPPNVPNSGNALIIGEVTFVTRLLNRVWPTLQKPVVHCEGGRLILPIGHHGTLVLRDAHELVERDQQRLLEWWDQDASQTRIIATASRQLYRSVENGGFSPRLLERFRDAQVLTPES